MRDESDVRDDKVSSHVRRGHDEPSCCHQPVSPRVRVSPGTGQRHPPHLSPEKHSQEITLCYVLYENQMTLIYWVCSRRLECPGKMFEGCVIKMNKCKHD